MQWQIDKLLGRIWSSKRIYIYNCIGLYNSLTHSSQLVCWCLLIHDWKINVDYFSFLTQKQSIQVFWIFGLEKLLTNVGTKDVALRALPVLSLLEDRCSAGPLWVLLEEMNAVLSSGWTRFKCLSQLLFCWSLLKVNA